MALGITWMSLAQQWIDSALAGMLNAIMPLTTAAVSALLLWRPPRVQQVVGLVVGCVGAFLIAVPELGAKGNSREAAAGVGLALVAVLSYSFAANISIPLTQRYGPLPVIWRTQLVACVISAPFGVAGLGDVDWQWSSMLAFVGCGVVLAGAVVASRSEI